MASEEGSTRIEYSPDMNLGPHTAEQYADIRRVARRLGLDISPEFRSS